MSVSLTASRSALAITLIAGFTMTVIGGASALTTDEIANYKGADRQNVLEAGAKKEGELLWIGGLNEKRGTRPILKAFKKKYPFIKAKAIRTGTSSALQRVLAEHRAKTYRVDLINANVVGDLIGAGLAQPFYSPNMAAFPKDQQDPRRITGNLRFSYHGVAAWNTDLVKKADAPQKYSELLNPKWKGKLIGTDSFETGIPYLITYYIKTQGEKKAIDFAMKLSKQKVKVSSASLRNVVDLMAAGEHTMLINPAVHHIGQAKKKKAPVEASMAGPVLARAGYFTVLTSAPHPHATMLLVDFLLTEQVGKIISKARYFPAHPAVKPIKSMQPYTPRARGLKQVSITDRDLDKLAKRSAEIFKKHFQ
jgi:iron(III) transport system substrate-binding protein